MHTSVYICMLVFCLKVFDVHQYFHVHVGIQSQVFNVHQCLHVYICWYSVSGCLMYTSVYMYMLVFSHRCLMYTSVYMCMLVFNLRVFTPVLSWTCWYSVTGCLMFTSVYMHMLAFCLKVFNVHQCFHVHVCILSQVV